MKNKQLLVLIVLLMLCLLAGAWLLLFDRQSRGDGTEDVAHDIAGTVAGGGQSALAAGKSAGELLADWTIADRVYSHRGSAGANEHSFEAYDAAIEAGSHNIEQDIVISKDGTLYVSHDLTAAAMTGDNRAYADMTDEEVDSLITKVGGHILKLSEVFERYGDKLRYVIELKSGDDATIGAFKDIVDAYDKADRITVQCFDIAVLEKLEDIYPDMPKLYLCETQSDVNRGIEAEFTDNISVDKSLISQDNCDAAHSAGKLFTAWTLDSESDIKRAISVGTDAYFTNDTPLALELERKYRPIRTEAKDHSSIFFASDYQAESGFDAPRDTLSALMASVNAGGKEPDMAVLCGDYTNEAADYRVSPESSIDEIRALIREHAPQISREDMLFVQGNHDALTDSIAASGLHEYDDYLVYVLNTENDFPWKQGKVSGSLDKVKRSARDMKACFGELIAEAETRPIFIAGHVPLHFTARTSSRHTTGDNLYASLIFDVVNEAAESLDIIYLYGHNHSKGWDCYMGGASVYKAIGDTLLLPAFDDSDVSTDTFEKKALNFTYMNAGYTGYYMNCEPGENPADYSASDEALTATVCEIYDDRIEITRYDPEGQHILGAAGAPDPYKGGIDSDMIGPEHYSEQTDGPAVIFRRANTSEDVQNEEPGKAA